MIVPEHSPFNHHIMDVTMTSIGRIRSELKKIEDCPKQESEQAPAAVLVIDEAFSDAAKDLHTGDRLVLVTWLHRGRRDELTTRPRDNAAAPLTGVFSTRSPNRPNPIGLHHIEIVEKLGPLEWRVSAIEVLNGTPVIDVKPVL
jgi:L-fuculose-phosphate aldolase